MGPAAPRHVGSSQTRARTHVPCISRQILNHCATREALTSLFLTPAVRCWWTAKVLTERCFKCTLYSGADVFLLSHNHIKFLNLRLRTDVPKCSLILFLSCLHHIEEDRTLSHGDSGGIESFIDLHRVIDWNIRGWDDRCHSYRLVSGDVEFNWQRQKSREEWL